MAKFYFCIFFSQIDHERIKVAERSAENDIRTIEIDHRFHRFGASIRFRDVLLLDGPHAPQGLEGFHGDRMCLIPAKIIAWSYIDDAERDIRRKRCAPSRS